MKDFTAIATEWLSEHLVPSVDDLARLLRTTYGDGLAAGQATPLQITPMPAKPDPAPPAPSAPPPIEVERPPVLTQRQEDALTAKTLKILGSEPRTHAALRLAPHKLRAVAAHAKVEPKVLREFLSGRQARSPHANAIRRSLRELGYPTEPGEVS